MAVLSSRAHERRSSISSRFLCPRPPLLLSAPNQNRHATQAIVNANSHARKKPLLTRYWTVQVTITSSSSVFLLMRRGGGELPNNDTAPAGSWIVAQRQSESILYNIKRGFTVFSHGIKHVVFTFGSVDKSIQMKPLGVLSHGTTYLACVLIVGPCIKSFWFNHSMVLFIQYVVLFNVESVESSEVTTQMKPLQQYFLMVLLV